MEQLKKDMTINIGPQHPATHGVLRMVVKLDGEKIEQLTPVIGYLHRGLEKMAESRTYLQYLPLVSRIDYLSGFFYSQSYCAAVEELTKIEVPKRAKYIRVLTMELNRIASHALWYGSMLMDLGATSPFFYAFREREVILHLFEELTGSRMMYNYYTFGGVKEDLPDGWLEKVAKFVDRMPEVINEYEDLVSENPIFRARMENIGIIKKEYALNYSLTGVNLRASGVNCDFRREKPYLVYNELLFDTPVGKIGDNYERYKLRMEEMRQSLKIVSQCVDWLARDKGEINSGVKPLALKPEQNEATSWVESSRGLTCCYIKSDGSTNPYRLKWRTPSFFTVGALPKIAKDLNYADLISTFGSLDVVLCEVDK